MFHPCNFFVKKSEGVFFFFFLKNDMSLLIFVTDKAPLLAEESSMAKVSIPEHGILDLVIRIEVCVF